MAGGALSNMFITRLQLDTLDLLPIAAAISRTADGAHTVDGRFDCTRSMPVCAITAVQIRVTGAFLCSTLSAADRHHSTVGTDCRTAGGIPVHEGCRASFTERDARTAYLAVFQCAQWRRYRH